MDSAEDFRKSNINPIFFPMTMKKYELLTSPKYVDFTNTAFSIIGHELEDMFHFSMPENAVFNYRQKSKHSFEKNVTNDAKVCYDSNGIPNSFSNTFNPYISYDIHGIKLIINSLPQDFYIPPEYLYEYFDFLNYGHDYKSWRGIYDTISGKYILEQIVKNSPELQKLGIFLNNNREKLLNKDNGYLAVHLCLQSTLLPNWVAEFQSKSVDAERIAKFGSANHQKREGKERILPTLPVKTNKVSVQEFLKYLDEILPKYFTYLGNRKIHKHSNYENFRHYFASQLKENSGYYLAICKLLESSKSEEFVPDFNKFLDEKEKI